MAKKVAKKASSTKKSMSKVELTEKRTKVAKVVPRNLKKSTISKSARPNEHCYPDGRVGVPVDQISYVKMQVSGRPSGLLDPEEIIPYRRIENLFGDHTSLSDKDFERLKNYAELDNLIKITFTTYQFTWSNFAVALNWLTGKNMIQCDQLWPPIKSKLDRSKKSSIQRKRTLDPFLGDIEISITWPDCEGDKPDPATTQQITINDVSISPYTPPSC